MKVSLQWLREWVDVGTDVPAFAHALTMAGLEVEGIVRAGPELSGIIVGEIRAFEKHPNAGKLNVCRVWDGARELQVVCGAPNVRVGMKAPLATVGSALPNGTQIGKAELRGVESHGMLCSARELGLGDEAGGLMDLPAEFAVGQALASALALDDSILEVGLTPNRGDCMSILGVAREAAAARGRALQVPAQVSVPAAIKDTFPVRIDASQGCPKFASRVIRNVRANAASPFWLQERLRRAGMRPINAIVDVTNYVVLELGQPMHAYDLHKLSGSIVVRFATAAETLLLLDGRRIELTPDVLLIADQHQPLGLAGIMGGENSGIGAATSDVLLEVAYFDPETIAGRGRRYGLVTDASQRFERGVDPQLQERAIERATQLLLECAGGQVGPVSVVRSSANSAPTVPIRVRHQRIQHVLGAKVDAAVVEDLLTRIGMTLAPGEGSWGVTPPSWRFDIRIEEDLIEEVARLYGFERIAALDARVDQQLLPWSELRVRTERAADLLVDRGYYEAITYTFTDAAAQAALLPEPALALSNPISADLGVMRVSLWPALLQALHHNYRRQQSRVRLFEVGRRFAADGAETEVIAGIAAGAALNEQWDVENRRVDFFDVKADLEALLSLTGDARSFRFSAEVHPTLHPGQSARIWRGSQPVGWLGVLHPEHVKRLDLPAAPILFEIETESGLASRLPQFVELSRFPAIRRDVAVVVADTVDAAAVQRVVEESAGQLLKELSVLSVYRGKQIEKGKKSIALGLHLQDTSRTLIDSEADAIVAQVVAALTRQLQATIRDK
jgi:phenylalanyl-tRNA synthetase beta chain